MGRLRRAEDSAAEPWVEFDLELPSDAGRDARPDAFGGGRGGIGGRDGPGLLPSGADDGCRWVRAR